MTLNLFYEEPDPDRWLPFDRYSRKLIRRMVRGKPRVGGQERVFLNLCAGLDKLGVEYRINDYRHSRRHPDELACIVGKPQVLDKIPWRNPILFGASVFAHPYEDPQLLTRLPVKKVLVPCEWMRRMFATCYGTAVEVWPVGIDTDLWHTPVPCEKKYDVLLYDKIRWYHDEYKRNLIQPIREHISRLGLVLTEIRYGDYREDHFRNMVQQSRCMVFLCEHESQGLALQQTLSSGVPVIAWDRQGVNPDPGILAQGIRFGPVTPVPYWDKRCGLVFHSAAEFPGAFDIFWQAVVAGSYEPRNYILENFTLEKCAQDYLRIARDLGSSSPAAISL